MGRDARAATTRQAIRHMGDHKDLKHSGRPVATAPERSAAAGKQVPAPGGTAAASGKHRPTGRVVHDDRGNAVWDWLKDTARIAIESTSRLLRKLEAPNLKVENEVDQELRIESDPDSGGGYDPYNQRTPTRKPGRG
jgi:hypothetical protein